VFSLWQSHEVLGLSLLCSRSPASIGAAKQALLNPLFNGWLLEAGTL
jgi:hypothetical protein